MKCTAFKIPTLVVSRLHAFYDTFISNMKARGSRKLAYIGTKIMKPTSNLCRYLREIVYI